MILSPKLITSIASNLTRQAGFIVTIYDEDGLRLASTPPLPTPSQAYVDYIDATPNKRV